MCSLKQNDTWNENLQELEQPVKWKTNLKDWKNWVLYGNNRKTGKQIFEESRIIFPDKEHGLNKLDYNKI